MGVSFVDTGILCNLLPVPGRDQDRDEVASQMLKKQQEGEILILPVTAVIETGNFIARVPDGRARRSTSETFVKMLELVLDDRAPWRLHEFMWGYEFIHDFIAGAGTGSSFVEHVVNRVGGGDLCILTERETYRKRTGINPVHIWTRDLRLAAHS